MAGFRRMAWLLALATLVAGGAALGEGGFKPGNVFASHLSDKYCFADPPNPPYPDLIWQIDPETGEASFFWALGGENCGVMTGLAFTPDGCRLRAAQCQQSRILEFAPDGSWTVPLDRDDGLRCPYGTNCLAYDAEGNFYVVNAGTSSILRFPAGGGSGTVFADAADGVGGGGSIAFSANGDLYLANWAPDYVLRFTPDGASSLFADFEPFGRSGSIGADSRHRVYAAVFTLEDPAIFEFIEPDPLSMRRVAGDDAFRQGYAMTTAPSQTELYVATLVPSQLLAVRVADGTFRVVATPLSSVADGIAVVPVIPGDVNRDRLVDFADWFAMWQCVRGPQVPAQTGPCPYADFDHDEDVDLRDVAGFHCVFGRAMPECP